MLLLIFFIKLLTLCMISSHIIFLVQVYTMLNSRKQKGDNLFSPLMSFCSLAAINFIVIYVLRPFRASCSLQKFSCIFLANMASIPWIFMISIVSLNKYYFFLSFFRRFHFVLEFVSIVLNRISNFLAFPILFFDNNWQTVLHFW